MSDILNLAFERDKRLAPDPEFVRTDDFGRKMYLFALEYRMDGDEWGCEVWAYDVADAQRRVDGMRQSLRILGQMYTAIPA